MEDHGNITDTINGFTILTLTWEKHATYSAWDAWLNWLSSYHHESSKNEFYDLIFKCIKMFFPGSSSNLLKLRGSEDAFSWQSVHRVASKISKKDN